MRISIKEGERKLESHRAASVRGCVGDSRDRGARMRERERDKTEKERGREMIVKQRK